MRSSSRVPALAADDIDRLPAIQGTAIYAGKKTEVIGLDALDANLVQRNAREIFAKVPGVFVYDMDGSGNQISVAARGLDPHRGWNSTSGWTASSRIPTCTPIPQATSACRWKPWSGSSWCAAPARCSTAHSSAAC
jgi:hypothetical protein